MVVLIDKYDLKCSIHKYDKINEKLRIYVWVEFMPILRSLVLPYIIPSMQYKIRGN